MNISKALLSFILFWLLANTGFAQETPPAITDSEYAISELNVDSNESAAEEISPSVNTSAAATNSSGTRSTGAASSSSSSFIELETTEVTGNRELPKVLSIVPWKKSLPNELVGRPENSLLNQLLEPIDRAEFRRKLDFYQEVRSQEEADE